MRTKAIALLLAFSLSSSIAYSANPPKSGAICSKLGAVQSYQNKKYTCIKNGKKLVWDKGTIISKNSIPSPSPSPSQIKPSIFVEPEPIVDFQSLPTRYKDIKYWAWKRTRAAADTNVNSTAPTEILIGPNSKNCFGKIQENIELMQRIFKGVRLPTKNWILVGDMKSDPAWLTEKTTSLLSTQQRQYNNGQLINPESVNTKEETVSWLEGSCDANFRGAMTVSHGFTHSLQKLQLLDSNGFFQADWGYLPRWLVEGGATFSEVFAAYGQDYKTYISSNFDWVEQSRYDKKFFTDYLLLIQPANGNLWSYTDNWPSHRAYDVGSYVCEILVALKGPTAILEIWSDFIQTKDFNKSFKNIFGISWNEAQPYISEAIYKEVMWQAGK